MALGYRRRELLVPGLWIIQDHRWPCFTEDAVLLADFAAQAPFERAVDLCCGTGIVTLLLAHRSSRAELWGIELIPEVAQLAASSVAANNLEMRVKILTADVCQATAVLPVDYFDLVTVNPPYQVRGCGRISPDPLVAAAHSEVWCTLPDVVREASLLLKSGGRFVLVQRYERLTEVFQLCAEYGLAVERWRPVQAMSGRRPHIFLLEARKAAAGAMCQLPALVLHEPDGCDSVEAAEIFAGGGKADD